MKVIHGIILVSVVTLFLPLSSTFADKTEDFKEGFYPSDIQFEEKIFDFGAVYEGDAVIHIYKFKNAGQGVLKIEEVRSSCGCTAVNLTSKEIEPGGTGEIKVTFNSRNYKGRITKHIYVHSNDPDESIITLEITGIVKVDVEVNPKMIDFGEIYEGESVSQKLMVLPGALDKLKIKKLEISSKEIAIKRSKYFEGDKEGVEVTVTIVGTRHGVSLPQGIFSEKLKIYTNSKIQPIIEVPVFGTVLGKIEVSPVEFAFEVHQGDSVVFEITLNKGLRRGFGINKIQDELGYFVAIILFLRQEVDKDIYGITLKPLSDAPQGSVRENLQLYTNDRRQPIIKILLNGIIQVSWLQDVVTNFTWLLATDY